MGIMVSPEKLRRFPLFAGLDDAMLKELAMASEEITLNEGEWLFHEGDRADALYVIFSGMIDLKIPVNEDDICPPSLCTLVAGEPLGWSALVEPYVYGLSALAITDVQLIKMDGVRVCELMGHYPTLGYQLMSRLTQIIGRRLTKLCVRFVSLVEGGRWQRLEGQPTSEPLDRN